ncbi:MAG: class A beta-lactamase [Pseudohongiellaceae bacterium]|nr:class A beta-lactamase [Pseudohongiellaceae bacterium]
MRRRQFSYIALGGIVASFFSPTLLAASNSAAEIVPQLRAIEESLGARLGVVLSDHHSNILLSYNGEQRFPMCSTFKLIAVSAVLARVDAGDYSLADRVSIAASELVSYSPITENRLGDNTMSLAEVCSAALMYSDNTAGNKLLERLGGPGSVTRFARSLGDPVTRLDRWETELNEAAIDDPRDTTSPRAMVGLLNKLVLGDTLSSSSRDQLLEWMRSNTTGDEKLRAGFPAHWLVAEKTAGGGNGSMADVGVAWPQTNRPVCIAVYMTETTASFPARNAAIALIARTITPLFRV